MQLITVDQLLSLLWQLELAASEQEDNKLHKFEMEQGIVVFQMCSSMGICCVRTTLSKGASCATTGALGENT